MNKEEFFCSPNALEIIDDSFEGLEWGRLKVYVKRKDIILEKHDDQEWYAISFGELSKINRNNIIIFNSDDDGAYYVSQQFIGAFCFKLQDKEVLKRIEDKEALKIVYYSALRTKNKRGFYHISQNLKYGYRIQGSNDLAKYRVMTKAYLILSDDEVEETSDILEGVMFVEDVMQYSQIIDPVMLDEVDYATAILAQKYDEARRRERSEAMEAFNYINISDDNLLGDILQGV
ncbi:hypothetical protein SAMN02910400_00589 [Lachnospiraceae bacterium C10]|nr:hypothetical protein SAMN02910400_00589 [Lachnospiraceae bacterium C10]